MIRDLDRARPPTDIMRTGRMFFLDDYETTIILPALGGGTSPVRTTTAGEVFRGEAAIALTTAAAQWATSFLDYYVTAQLINQSSLFGISCWFCYEAGIPFLELDFFLDDGTNRHEMKVGFDRGSNRLEYYNAASQYVAIPGGGIATIQWGAYYWYYIKAVFDPVNDAYAWVLFNDKLIDLSALRGRTVANPGRTITIGLQNTAQTGTAATACVDDIVVTMEEPTYAELLASIEYKDIMGIKT